VEKSDCIKGELNPQWVGFHSLDGNNPGYHYPINASRRMMEVKVKPVNYNKVAGLVCALSVTG